MNERSSPDCGVESPYLQSRSLHTRGLQSSGRGRMNKSLKLVYLVIGIACLMLGIIGLIIPIIPGVLFLMAALYLLSRGSRRIKRFSEGQPHMRRMHRRIEKLGEVDLSDRCRLAGWMMIEAGVKGLNSVRPLSPSFLFPHESSKTNLD